MSNSTEYYRSKVAVVTGGVSGIGLALAETMLSYGAERDVSGAKYCFNPDDAKSYDDYLLDVARKRRSGEWVV